MAAAKLSTGRKPRDVTTRSARVLKLATVTRKASGANRCHPNSSPAATTARPRPRPVSSGRSPPPVSSAESSYVPPGTCPSGPNDRKPMSSPPDRTAKNPFAGSR
jgi:hypothetical protein